MYKVLSIIGLIAVALFFVIQAKNGTHTLENNKLQIATSFYPLYFFSSQIGGDKAVVKNITPSGSEPHDYEPTSQDTARIEKSNMLILNGGVEAWGDKIKENIKDKKVKVIVAGEGQFTQKLTEEEKEKLDPHIWLDPLIAINMGDKILNGYMNLDPKNQSFYSVNFNSLVKKLDKLDQDYKKGLANCKSKDIITSHAAFGYLASRYGLHQVAISGLSPDEEPSSKALADVANFAKEKNIKYIFFESLVSPKLAETIASEIGAKTLVLDPLEGLSDDDIKRGKNYFTVMQDNLKNLQTALECSK